MAGLGRDDASGLYQKQAQSVNNPDLLSIGLHQLAVSNAANEGRIPDQQFLIWGDNGGKLFFAKKSTGFPEMLAREWMVEVKGNETFPSTQLAFQISQLPVMAEEKEIYWLGIDRTGRGDFGPGEVDFIPASHISSNGKAYFEQLFWDVDGSGKDIFSMAKGPPMMAVSWLEAMSCFPQTNGRLHLQVFGGQAPYKGKLVQLTTQKGLNFEIRRDHVLSLDAIEAGEYELTVQDKAGNRFTQHLFLQSTDAPKSRLSSTYLLQADSSLWLDASFNQPSDLSYEWRGPSGISSNQANIQIQQAGLYELYLNQAGCVSRQEIRVETSINPLFRQVSLFPNPVLAGEDFHLKLLLRHAEPVRLQITDALGKTIKSTWLPASDYHFCSDKLFSPGTYFISLKGQTEEQSVRLMVR